ncbi:hypothetical protein RAS1_08530 [Phycisphaerae bacterium RAS1]|nr:hypothetical protein RAS1_08530 [Phycisphaerae bacterium RAS1]
MQSETRLPESLSNSSDLRVWPARPAAFGELLTPIEAAQYLRLDEIDAHTPASAVRTLNYWRDKRQLKATKFARRVWYRRAELDRFMELKTEQ